MKLNKENVLKIIKEKNNTEWIETKELDTKGNYVKKKPMFNPYVVSSELKVPYSELKSFIDKSDDNELKREWNIYFDRFVSARYDKAIEMKDKTAMTNIEEKYFGMLSEEKAIPDIQFIFKDKK